MFQVNDAMELVIVFGMVIVAQTLLYFAQRWMDKDEEED